MPHFIRYSPEQPQQLLRLSRPLTLRRDDDEQEWVVRLRRPQRLARQQGPHYQH